VKHQPERESQAALPGLDPRQFCAKMAAPKVDPERSEFRVAPRISGRAQTLSDRVEKIEHPLVADLQGSFVSRIAQ
jgi:hypothetical protein